MMNQNSAILQPLDCSYEAEGRFDADFSPTKSSQSPAGIERCLVVPVRRGRVKVPMRLVESPHYTDAALSVYVKVKALGLRPEGCTAGVATLASYLGMSASTVQRGLALLRAEAPDGIIELPDSRRRSLPGGRGTTACRRVRPLQSAERFIWLPVAASEDLRPRLLRALAIIAFAVTQKIPLTESALAGFLHHHSGPRAGETISPDAAGRIVDELAASGWISVRRRAGLQGRHVFVVHDEPVVASHDFDDRSGLDADARSLAYKEDLMTDRPENDAAPFSSAVGEIPVDKDVDTSVPRAGVSGAADGRALRAEDKTPVISSSLTRTEPYHGPPLTFSGRLHAVLEPVRFLLRSVNTYVQRRIGREIARQLDDGVTVPRLQARLTQRLAQTFVDEIRDAGRWLLGVALPRWGCANPDCETGVLWSTGTRCPACREVASVRRHRTPPPRTELGGEAGARNVSCSVAVPQPPEARIVSCCPGCERPHRPGNSGLCDGCRTANEPVTAGDGARCRGNDGMCGRPAPHGLCWRCRIASEGQSVAAPPSTERRQDLQGRPTRVVSRTGLSSEVSRSSSRSRLRRGGYGWCPAGWCPAGWCRCDQCITPGHGAAVAQLSE
ncbi:hypothetical protein [Streptomyces sp. DSM 118148]|uniref:hypothetical protein n=1 Tax=Streptomyces sp. DSM 118148 TaxID=3448667 RepID=UPI00404025F6